MTLSVKSSILIRRTAAEVFAYVSDYAREPTWLATPGGGRV
jgi:hypothetical protein